MTKPKFVKTNLDAVDRNFQELTKLWGAFFPGVTAVAPISATLAAGDNAITPTITNPQGRLITFQDAAASLFDKGMVDGKWVINASAPCNIKLTFF